MSMAVTLAFTWTAIWLIGWHFEQAQPVATRIAHVGLLEAPNGASARTLRVEFNTPPPGNCTRFSEATLYSDGVDVPVEYPLGVGVNGSGFGARNGAVFGTRTPPKQPLTYVVMLPLPPELPDGLYQFVYRSLYTCPFFGGFVVRRIPFEAPPVALTVGAR
jgi:hypothetical protein